MASIGAVAMLPLWASLAAGGGAPPPPPIQIGVTKQLLHDDFLVESLEGGRRVVRTVAPTVVIQPDAEWEAGYQLGAAGGVVKERDGTVRLWCGQALKMCDCTCGTQKTCSVHVVPARWERCLELPPRGARARIVRTHYRERTQSRLRTM